MKTALYTALALVAFAGNSVLCRLALGEEAIDASSFTSIRLLSGVVVLVLISLLTQQRNTAVAEGGSAASIVVKNAAAKGSWKASLMLFLYAVTFSYAYISLETGTGALILFTAVQITMILVGVFSGNKLYRVEWLGLAIAFFGFVYLVLPGLATPSLTGFVLMSVSGVAWGAYTLAGKGSVNPLGDTTYNFIRTLPFVAILVAVTFQTADLSQKGIVLAVLSGAIASGVGYTIWYMALKNLATVHAAVVQLLVPVIAALGGVLFVAEPLSLRLAVSSVLILGGIFTVILGRYRTE